MNVTTQKIIERLRDAPIVTPQDIADAYGRKTTAFVLADIKVGKLAANAPKGVFHIARTEAVRYIKESEYIPDEAEL